MWQARRDWPAETPTAARVDREHRDDGGKGKGSKGKGGKAWNRRTSVPYDLSVEKLYKISSSLWSFGCFLWENNSIQEREREI